MEDVLKPEIISNSASLEAVIRAETDVAINTAKMWPRSIAKCVADAEALATLDEDTAAGCFYALNRGGSPIEGPSVRLAEIMVNSWGNIKAASRIISNDGKTITAQAICHDLEKNVSISVEVKRRITTKTGATFSEDMQVVAGNAASAIALRNAVFKVIPMALTKNIYEKAKKVAIGEGMTMTNRRTNAFKFFKSLGVGEERVLAVLKRNTIEDVNAKDMEILIGFKTAISNGDQQADEAFPKLQQEVSKDNAQAKSNAAINNAMDKIKEQQEKKNGGQKLKPVAPQPAQNETLPNGEPNYYYVLQKEMALELEGEPIICEAGTQARYENGAWEVKGVIVDEQYLLDNPAFNSVIIS